MRTKIKLVKILNFKQLDTTVLSKKNGTILKIFSTITTKFNTLSKNLAPYQQNLTPCQKF